MLAVSAGALDVGTSLTHIVDSVSDVDRKSTPILLFPIDGRVATALRPDVEESWLSSTPTGARRASRRQSATVSRPVDDSSYRHKRQRNNEAARRSREKRRQQDGVIRRQLEALAVENRELRCQLALFRRLLDEVAAGTLASSYHKLGGGVLQPGWSLSSISSSAALSTTSDQSRHDDVTDDLSVDDVSTVGGELKLQRDEHIDDKSSNVSETGDRQQCQLLTPLNLSRRVASS